MKRLLKAMESKRGAFEPGGRLASARPMYEAMVNFCFAPSRRTRVAPHARDPLDIKRFMSMVIVALLPCLFASIYFFGWRVLAMIVVSYAAGGAVEVIFAVVRKEEINEGFLVTGMLFPLILPPALPLWIVAVGVAFGVLVGKEVFGGTGRNLFNPAILGRCFVAMAYAKPMAKTGWIEPIAHWPGRLLQYVSSSNVDAVSTATPLGLAQQAPPQFVETAGLLWGNVSGSAGETSALAILIGGLFLLATRVANWRTVVSVLGSFLAAAGALHLALPDRFGPPIWSLLAGGLMFGAFFMATDPVTSPVTKAGKWIYGAVIGVATVLIRNLTGFAEGMMFAILLGNIAAPILDEIAFGVRLRRLANEG